MSNIVSIRGSRKSRKVHDRALRVGNMVPGMTRYVTETAVANNMLNENFAVSRVPHGKFSVRVECLAPHKYAIAYEGNQEGLIEPNPWECVIDPGSELQPVVSTTCGFVEVNTNDQS